MSPLVFRKNTISNSMQSVWRSRALGRGGDRRRGHCSSPGGSPATGAKGAAPWTAALALRLIDGFGDAGPAPVLINGTCGEFAVAIVLLELVRDRALRTVLELNETIGATLQSPFEPVGCADGESARPRSVGAWSEGALIEHREAVPGRCRHLSLLKAARGILGSAIWRSSRRVSLRSASLVERWFAVSHCRHSPPAEGVSPGRACRETAEVGGRVRRHSVGDGCDS